MVGGFAEVVDKGKQLWIRLVYKLWLSAYCCLTARITELECSGMTMAAAAGAIGSCER